MVLEGGNEKKQGNNQSIFLETAPGMPAGQGTSLWNAYLGELLCNDLLKSFLKKVSHLLLEQLNLIRLLWHIKTLPGKMQLEHST